MERQSHNNPWADKLQEVSIPEAGEAWQAMETLLNKELPGPVPRAINWGRWFGFSFSAVALTVAVYFIWFGRHQPTQGSDQGSAQGPAVAVSGGRTAVSPSPARPGGSSGAFPSSSQDSPGSQGSPASSSAGAASAGAGATSSSANAGHLPANRRSSSADAGSTKIAGANASPANPGHPSAAVSPGSVYSGSALSLRPTRHPSLHQKTHDLTATRHRNAASNRYQDTHTTPANKTAGTTPGDAFSAMRGNASGDMHGATSLAATGNAPGVSSGALAKQHSLHHSYPGEIRSLDIPPPGAISARMTLPNWKNYPVPLKAKSAERSRSNSPMSISQRGWQLAIGFNQPVVFGGQGAWNKRAGGVNPALLDYIPVPSISYYFQPKLYVQVEARFHAPQYTQRNLGFNYTNFDTTSSALPTGSIYIEKLFYFQLPVSVHFSPFPNWSVGLGVEYSRYSKGIAYNNFFPGAKPTYLSRYPTLYIEPSEWRGMISLNYTFRKWVVGITYDEAFNRFMHTQLSGPTIFNSQTLARNSALQLTLRYTLWDSRKRRSPAK